MRTTPSSRRRSNALRSMFIEPTSARAPSASSSFACSLRCFCRRTLTSERSTIRSEEKVSAMSQGLRPCFPPHSSRTLTPRARTDAVVDQHRFLMRHHEPWVAPLDVDVRAAQAFEGGVVGALPRGFLGVQHDLHLYTTLGRGEQRIDEARVVESELDGAQRVLRR